MGCGTDPTPGEAGGGSGPAAWAKNSPAALSPPGRRNTVPSVQEKVGNRVIPVVSVGAVFLIMAALSLARGCSASDTPDTRDPEVVQGERIYQVICVTCHDVDPNQDRGTQGTYGPAIAGSSLELLRMRVREVKYPEGYTPKRTTSLMTPLPYLNDQQIDQLYAYLTYAAANAPAGSMPSK